MFTTNSLLPIIFVFVGVLFVLLSIPLMLEKIPLNGLYGFRTENTLSDPEIWYRVNKDFGYKFAYAGVISIVCNIILFLYSDILNINYIIIIGILSLIVPLLVSIGLTH